jgi:hypothetical protein
VHTRRMSQATYRIVPLSIIRYGIEVTRPDKAARILLTCPTEDAANPENARAGSVGLIPPARLYKIDH